mgnify:CR=1 FL=1
MKGFYAAAAAALLLSAALVSCTPRGQRMQVEIFCVANQPMSDGLDVLHAEERTIPAATGTALYRRLVSEMIRTPGQAQLSAALPQGVILTEVSESGGVVRCVFSEQLAEVPPAELTRTLCAVTTTLCRFPEVKGVCVLAGETALHEGVLTQDSYVTQRDSLHIESCDLTLYYPNAAGTALESALCTVRLPVNANAAQAVMETLLSGPVTDRGYVIRFIPEGTRLNAVYMAGSICCVDLSEEFLSENTASADGTSLTVYAIVNSLTSLQDVTGVQFLIDGEPRQAYIHPHFDQIITSRTPGSVLGGNGGN